MEDGGGLGKWGALEGGEALEDRMTLEGTRSFGFGRCGIMVISGKILEIRVCSLFS